MGKQLDKIVNKWKVFKVEIFKAGEAGGDVDPGWAEGVDGPLAPVRRPDRQRRSPSRSGKEITGVFDNIKAFVKAVERATPGVAEGLKNLGEGDAPDRDDHWPSSTAELLEESRGSVYNAIRVILFTSLWS